MSSVNGNHLAKVGGDLRLVRMETDQQGGTTYSFQSVNDSWRTADNRLNIRRPQRAERVQQRRERTAPHSRSILDGFAQDKWRVTRNLTLSYGLRNDYYTPLEERGQPIVKFNLENGVLDPPTTPLHGQKKTNIQPRVAMVYAPGSRTVFRTGFGIFVGPGQGEDLIQPIEANASSRPFPRPVPRYPLNSKQARDNFNQQSKQPLLSAAGLCDGNTTFQRRSTNTRRRFSGNWVAGSRRPSAYVGSQGRNLFLRSVGNQID